MLTITEFPTTLLLLLKTEQVFFSSFFLLFFSDITYSDSTSCSFHAGKSVIFHACKTRKEKKKRKKIVFAICPDCILYANSDSNSYIGHFLITPISVATENNAVFFFFSNMTYSGSTSYTFHADIQGFSTHD